jgi:hypothetical protein
MAVQETGHSRNCICVYVSGSAHNLRTAYSIYTNFSYLFSSDFINGQNYPCA